jgi:hypothetical protein
MFVTPEPSPTSEPAVKVPPISRLSAGPIFLSWPFSSTTTLLTKSDMEIPFKPVSPAGPGGG